MERLYSQYPNGVVGLAVLLLRIVVSSWLTRDAIHSIINSPPTESMIQIVINALLISLSLFVVFGLRTSYVLIASVGLLLTSELYSRISDDQGWFCLLLLVLVSVSVALLGPGGYSLDARLSGWRSINISSGTKG
jgi:hypothetical protein